MIPERVRTVLDEHGLTALEFEPGSTPTAPTAAEKIGVSVGQIAKSMLLRGKDGKYRLFVLAGDHRISSAKVKAVTGSKHSMCSSEETTRVTGFRPGGVCPFGLTGDGPERQDRPEIDVYLDRSLEQYSVVYPAAGTDSSGVPVSPDALRTITGGRVCEVSERPG